MSTKVFTFKNKRPKRTEEEKKALRKKADAEFERMSQLVDVEFRYYEGEGTFSFMYKWFDKDLATRYEFEGNKRYRIPRGVVEYINKLGVPERMYGPTDPNDVYKYPEIKIKKITKRFEFVPTSFINDFNFESSDKKTENEGQKEQKPQNRQEKAK